MSNTERMIRYTKLPQEPAHHLPIDSTHKSWPTQGAITFKNVHMRYREDLPDILKGVDFSIKGGEKVGCVGRTGAGKSSIIQVLFRMVELNLSEK